MYSAFYRYIVYLMRYIFGTVNTINRFFFIHDDYSIALLNLWELRTDKQTKPIQMIITSIRYTYN